MGPFGQTVGNIVNDFIGLTGYLLVLVLAVAALRIFAGGLGKQDKAPVSLLALWRERIGLFFTMIFLSTLLYLLLRSWRIHGASPGGLVGEIAGEVLRALASTAGAWVLCLAGLALSVVLATNLSLARAGHQVWLTVRGTGPVLTRAARRASHQIKIAGASLAQSFRRRELAADASGAAVLPPVLRLDLADMPEEVQAPEPAQGNHERRICEDLPRDLEINLTDEMLAELQVHEPPRIPALMDLEPAPEDALTSRQAEAQAVREAQADVEAQTGRAGKQARARGKSKQGQVAAEDRSVEQVEAGAENLTAAADTAAGANEETEPAAVDALTIIEPQYRELSQATPEDEFAAEMQVDEPTDGPGFVLNSETYKPPPLSLLEYERTVDSTIDRDAIYKQAERLVKTLDDYKIKGRVTEVHPGPVVTMYEFVPAPGTRISKVANLANDLAMSLHARRVRIVAPIPGKGAIGIEVPNERRDAVYFKEIVAHDAFRKSKSKLTLALGKNIVGAPVTLDLAKMPHLLVAGATGAGKSVSINAMICSLLLNASPEEVRLIMVDPKYLELSGYNGIPHLMLPVVTDPAKANIALRWAVREMERRYQLLADMRVRDIKTFNRKVDKLRGQAAEEAEERGGADDPVNTIKEATPSKILVVRKNADGTEVPLGSAVRPDGAAGPEVEAALSEAVSGADPGELAPPAELEPALPARRSKDPLPTRLPYIVVVIDEFADLMMVASKDVETSVARLAQKARAAGIHVILATQRPSVDVITGLIKANFPSRISFAVASCHDSKTILGSQGAENLLGAGDMLVLDRGSEMKRLHGAFISDQEIQRIVDWLKDQGRPVYDMDILKPAEDEEESGAPELEDGHDEMYDQAVALVAESRQASISMIQRRLRVGYNRAARMVERMEREGIVGPPDRVKGREVLIQPI